MNKKFLSAILFGALMVTSTGTFVSCKDYDDDIDGVQTQVDANKSAIASLTSQASALQSALDAAKATAEAAKTAAADAKKAGDDALAAAKAAEAAAADAKAEAIVEAQKQVDALKAWVEGQDHVTEEGLAEALLPVSAKISAIEENLDQIIVYMQENLGANIQTALKNIMTLQEDLAIHQATLDNYAALLEELDAADEELWAELTSTREDLQQAVSALNLLLEKETGALWAELTSTREGLQEALTGLSNLVNKNYDDLSAEITTTREGLQEALTALANLIEDANVADEELWAELTTTRENLQQAITALSNVHADEIADLQAEIGSIYAAIGQTTTNLNNLIETNFDEVWAEISSNHSVVNQAITNVYNLLMKDANLKSLAFIPEVINTYGLGVVEFYSLELKDVNNQTVYVSNTPTATYRVNPTNANQSEYTWSFINRAVTTRAAGDYNDLITIVKSEEAVGSRKFWLQADNEVLNKLDSDKTSIIALKATKEDKETKEKCEVVSDYATVTTKVLKEFALAQLNEEGKYVKYYSATVPTLKVDADVELVYTGELDLKPIVEAWSKEVPAALVDLKVDSIKYEFEKVEEYLGADKITDQQKFIVLENGVVSVDKEWLNKGGTASIGRTPVVKAVATVNGLEIATGYIKIAIVDEETVAPEEKKDLEIIVNLGDIEYTTINAEDGNEYKFDWARANAEIYDVLGLTRETFHKYYMSPRKNNSVTGVVTEAWTFGSTDTETAKALITINNKVALGEGGVEIVYSAIDNYQYPNVVIKFEYNIVHAKSLPTLNPDYLIGTNIIQVKGRMEGDAWKLISDMDEHFEDYLAAYELPNNHTKFSFRLKTEVPAQTGATIDGNDYTDQVIKLTTPFATTETSRDYNIQAVATLANGEECVLDYVVRFVRPFNATVSEMELKTFTANHDKKDLSKLIVIKDLDNKVVYENGKYTQYGINTYKLDNAGIEFTYAYNADESFGDKLTIVDTSWIDWYNGGADLQQNKTATSVVTITIPEIATLQEKGVITVLSTDNSK